MKIFISIKKKWLQHRVYKYTLKYENALSKSNYHLQLADVYYKATTLGSPYLWVDDSRYCIKNHQRCQKEKLNSDLYKNLSDIYLDKKLDLEEKLQFLNTPKA